MAYNKKHELSEEYKKFFKSIVDHCDDEDRAVRDRQIKTWRQLKLLWENIQHAYYSEVAHDWRIPDVERIGEDTDQGYYDKPVNVYRALLESIIAALSVTVPPVTCYPDDADNPIDLTTAKGGDKIAELLFRHNNAPLLWIHALFVFVTEGMTACYTYPDYNEKYGTYTDKKYREELEEHEITICPLCQYEMADKIITAEQMDKFAPGDEDVPVDNLLSEMDICENCARTVIPDKRNQSFTVTRLVGITSKPKSRICMEVKGGLNVKVPNWARNQKDCNYLIDSHETHYANAIAEFQQYDPDIRNKIKSGGQATFDLYEQWGRISPQYRGEQPVHNVTIRKCWFRPEIFNILDADVAEELTEKYPFGAKVVVVDDHVIYACPEAMDDYWTITQNPLADYIHFDPLGLLLTSIQEITNDLISLTLQTIEHGIPQTFADPKVLNFKAYRDNEVLPGGIYPATPKSGKPLSEGFYEVKTATLSQEVLPFTQKVQEAGQFVSGALPSLFGGQMSGSRTASEYSMSRAQALQRLQTNWKMLTMWWKDVFGKAIPLFIKEMKDDEKQVKKDEFGNFINVFIRKSELEGKIGSIELEANENLPITWNQQKDTIMQLFEMNNEGVMQTLASPENLPYLKRAIGLTDYIIPGEDDRQKQYEEIQQLINSEPIIMPPSEDQIMMAISMGQEPQPMEFPSVEPDFDVDNHLLEADICRRWLVSDAGRLIKLENPPGYKNVLLHMKMHKDMDMQLQMQQMMTQPPPEEQNKGSKEKAPEKNSGKPLNEGAESVPTTA